MKALIGTKMGMTQIFDEDRVIPVTVVRAGPVRVTQVKTPERDGYGAVQVGFGEKKARHTSSGEAGHLAKAGVTTAKHLAEFKVDDPEAYELGQEFKVGHVFEKGMRADVSATSKGKGFSGVMKRHNFKGQLASHGVHRVHRAPGSIGACATPARVFKGMRMAGHMGNEKVTILNMEVVDVDHKANLLLLKGAIPGAKGTTVVVRHSVKVPEQEVSEPPVEEEPAIEEAVAEDQAEAETAEAAAEAPADDQPADEAPAEEAATDEAPEASDDTGEEE